LLSDFYGIADGHKSRRSQAICKPETLKENIRIEEKQEDKKNAR